MPLAMTGGDNALISGGIYLIRKKLKSLISTLPMSIENEMFPSLVKRKGIKGLVFDDFFIDIGVKTDLLLAKKQLPKKFKFT